jgi:hypothetical protein
MISMILNTKLLNYFEVMILIISLIFIMGCGHKEPDYPHATVSGTVTLDGKKLTEGSIQALSPSASVSTYLDQEGRFILKHVPIGNVRFIVLSVEDTGKTEKDPLGNDIVIKVNRIPKKYALGIEKEIKSDVIDMKLELNSQ